MISRPTMAITSRSSLSAAATHEHACSALFSTCPLQTGGDGEPEEHSNPSPRTPESMAPKNLGAGIVLPGATPPCMLGSGLHTIKSKHGLSVASCSWSYVPPISKLLAPSGASVVTVST
jgi:hypothetical protein